MPVSGTFWQATQPVSAASLPLPTGAAKETGGNLDTLATYLNTLQGVVSSARAAVNLVAGQAGITAGAGAVGASTPRTTLASDDPAVAALGAVADAIAAAGATGSISAKLRRATQGLEDLKSLIVLAAGSAIIGKVGIDQTTPGTTDSVSVATGQGAGAAIGSTTGAKVITDANGTLQQYLRGLVYLLGTAGVVVDTELPAAGALSDGLSNPTTPMAGGCNLLWDAVNSQWVREPAPTSASLMSSTPRVATTATGTQTNRGHRGVTIHWSVTGVAGGGQTATLQIQELDPVTGGWVTLNFPETSTTTGTGLFAIELYPGASGGTNAASNYVVARVSGALPLNWRVNVVHSGGGTWTYSVGAQLKR